MKSISSGVSRKVRNDAGRVIFMLLAVTALASPARSGAQPDAASESVDIPGRAIADWGEIANALAHGGKGGMVNMIPSVQDATASRAAVVGFFVLHLKP